jgi:alpha-farnesene synthase
MHYLWKQSGTTWATHHASLHEYLSNAWISSAGPLLLIHEFFSMGHEITKGMEDFLEKNQEIVHKISMII